MRDDDLARVREQQTAIMQAHADLFGPKLLPFPYGDDAPPMPPVPRELSLTALGSWTEAERAELESYVEKYAPAWVAAEVAATDDDTRYGLFEELAGWWNQLLSMRATEALYQLPEHERGAFRGRNVSRTTNLEIRGRVAMLRRCSSRVPSRYRAVRVAPRRRTRRAGRTRARAPAREPADPDLPAVARRIPRGGAA